MTQSTVPTYELIYFPIHGRAEVLRLTFSLAQTAFTDVPVTDWATLKPQMPLGQVPDDVLHHHHGTIYDQTEIDGPKAHEIAGEPGLHHADERDQHGEGNGRGHDDACAQVAKKQKEDRYDQQPAFQQVVADGLHDLRDEDRAIIIGFDGDAGGEGRLNVLHPRLHASDHLLRIFSGQHLHHADDGLALTHGRGGSDPER